MPIVTNQAPGLFIQELKGERTIQAVSTSVAAFVGQAPNPNAHLNEVFFVNNPQQFRTEFAAGDNVKSTWLSHAVFGFFQNRGSRCAILNLPDSEPLAGSDKPPRSGLKLLEENDEVSMVLAPGRFDAVSHEALISHCESMGSRFAILDLADIKNTELLKTVETVPVPATKGKDKDKDAAAGGDAGAKGAGGARPRASAYAATYFPWVVMADPLSSTGDLVLTPPSGQIAGVYARTDVDRGVHKAPANTPVVGAVNLSYRVTSAEQAGLNQAGINCIRWWTPDGSTVWGCRTLAELGSEWTYVNVRRVLIFIEESIKRNMRWAVFEPNDRPLWKSVRTEISKFLKIMWQDGALMGATPEEAFFVKCDEETNPPELIDLGQLTTLIGVAPSKPAEFIVFKIGQTLGGTQVEAL